MLRLINSCCWRCVRNSQFGFQGLGQINCVYLTLKCKISYGGLSFITYHIFCSKLYLFKEWICKLYLLIYLFPLCSYKRKPQRPIERDLNLSYVGKITTTTLVTKVTVNIYVIWHLKVDFSVINKTKHMLMWSRSILEALENSSVCLRDSSWMTSNIYRRCKSISRKINQ